MIDQLRRGPIEGRTDLEAAIALTELVHAQLQCFGTDGSHTLDDGEIGAAILALRAVLRRLTTDFQLPFRNFSTLPVSLDQERGEQLLAGTERHAR